MKPTRLAQTLAGSAALLMAALPVMGQAADIQPIYVDPDYESPKTSWGAPDLSGIFTVASGVGFERSEALGAKEFWTAEEIAEREAAAAARAAGAAPRDWGVHYDNDQFGLTSATSGIANVPNNRTSIVTGPTGRVPEMIPAAVERQQAARAAAQGHQYDGPENRGIAERCIYWGHEGPPMRPIGYNGTLQIEQSDGYVTIRHEMISQTRIIPTDGRDHVDEAIRSYFGDSVGHWEGDTLVVDTTNFNDTPPVGRGATRNTHVVERFTRTGPDIITYQFTVSDPSTWEESWSGEFPLGRIDGLVYEYACHEGNYGMAGVLSGQRVTELQEAQAQQ